MIPRGGGVIGSISCRRSLCAFREAGVQTCRASSSPGNRPASEHLLCAFIPAVSEPPEHAPPEPWDLPASPRSAPAPPAITHPHQTGLPAGTLHLELCTHHSPACSRDAGTQAPSEQDMPDLSPSVQTRAECVLYISKLLPILRAQMVPSVSR